MQSHSPVCRFCSHTLSRDFIDLGLSPLCQNHISEDQLNKPENFYPLHAYVCDNCLLVQLEEFVPPDEIFSDYHYFSSFSDSWVEHTRKYSESMIERLGLNTASLVAEIASNDGYLLQHFVKQNIPVLGVEPAKNVADVANEKGIRTVSRFLGQESGKMIAAEYGRADLLAGNNVLAHVPDINDFVLGLKSMLAADGMLTMEFPHLLRLIENNQFDTIYHEHFSYLSLLAVQKIFRHHGIEIVDVDELPTHGGSLRIYAKHSDAPCEISPSIDRLLEAERSFGLAGTDVYSNFSEKVRNTKHKLLQFLTEARLNGKTIVGYGAPGKGNTLLNYCGIRQDFLEYTVDRSPYKQGKYTPGTRIPILHPDTIRQTKPDFILILPWNLKNEIIQQMDFVREWGGQFVIPIPEVEVIS